MHLVCIHLPGPGWEEELPVPPSQVAPTDPETVCRWRRSCILHPQHPQRLSSSCSRLPPTRPPYQPSAFVMAARAPWPSCRDQIASNTAGAASTNLMPRGSPPGTLGGRWARAKGGGAWLCLHPHPPRASPRLHLPLPPCLHPRQKPLPALRPSISKNGCNLCALAWKGRNSFMMQGREIPEHMPKAAA